MTLPDSKPAAQPAAKPTVNRGDDPRHPNKRLAALFDTGTFVQLTADGDSGMLAGHGLVDGTHAVAFASDPTVMGGAMGSEGCKVIIAAYARVLADQVPIIGLWHSGGARLAEGVVGEAAAVAVVARALPVELPVVVPGVVRVPRGSPPAVAPSR